MDQAPNWFGEGYPIIRARMGSVAFRVPLVQFYVPGDWVNRSVPGSDRMPLAELRSRRLPVESGEFGADMQVEIHNDGPVTILLERLP